MMSLTSSRLSQERQFTHTTGVMLPNPYSAATYFRGVTPSFLPTDDLIASHNKAILFLSTDMNSKFPPTNNQLRTSSNPRTQATVQDGRVTVQNIQRRPSQCYRVNTRKSQAITGMRGTNTVSDVNANQSRVIRCYNYKGGGHMAKQCTAKKRVKDAEWLEDMDDCDDLQLHTNLNFKEDHVDAYDSDCDDEATACAIFMANLSPTGSINRDTAETKYNDHVVFNNNSCDELTCNSNIISYADYMVTIENDAAQYVPPPEQDKNAKIFQKESSAKQDKYIEEHVDLEKAKKELENIIYKVGQTTQTMHTLIKPQKFYDNTHKTALGYQNPLYLTQAQRKQPVLYNAKALIEKHNPISMYDSEDTLITAEESHLSRLKIELLNQKESNNPFNELSKSFAKLEKQCISLKLSLQNTKEEMICNEPWKVNEASLITKINNKSFEITDLKSQLQEKSIVVNELKQLLATLKEKSQMTLCEPLDADFRFQKIKDENLRAQLQAKFSEPQLNQNGTSMNTKFAKPLTSRTKLYSVTLFPKPQFIPKVVKKNNFSKIVNSHLHTNKFKNNRDVHRDYLKVTKEHVKTLQELLEEARVLKPLDEHIGNASKFAEQIQELLVYVSASFPFTESENEKWAPATCHRRNNNPYANTQLYVAKENVQKINNIVFPSTRRASYTNVSGSQPKSNTRNDRIQRPSSRSEKNKVEAKHRKFKSSSNKNNHVSDCNANVKNVDLSSNSANVCLSCNECLFSENHDVCVVIYLKDVNKSIKVKSVKRKENIQWKPTKKVFTTIGHRWIPTRRMFSVKENTCFIPKNTHATIVPLVDRLQTISVLAVATNTETRMRYSIKKNSLMEAYNNCYAHPFIKPSDNIK
ncbi:hypothetical protein Tco_0819823 [Tanacetum coccineum]|uniref:Uncharacterized protein n=1 Tax=Tanacetum coccineum TaxID=301880 RepID=A0ABQ5A9E0_9ASTR